MSQTTASLTTVRIEQGKGQKDRNGMLSPRLLELLEEWWLIGQPTTWLFPGRDPLLPITTRQLYRVVTETARAVADREAGVAAHVAAQLRDPSLGAGCRYPVRSKWLSGIPSSIRRRAMRMSRARCCATW